jgi:hypothetical protein
MSRLLTLFFLAGLTSCFTAAGQEAVADPAAPSARPRFLTAEVVLDSGAQPLAAYQVEVTVTNTAARIVGIEGGSHPAFRTPPYYDPKALQGERIILAAFSTAAEGSLPKGRTRVATLHLRVAGDVGPQFRLQLAVAAGPDGKPLVCKPEIVERSTK